MSILAQWWQNFQRAYSFILVGCHGFGIAYTCIMHWNVCKHALSYFYLPFQNRTPLALPKVSIIDHEHASDSISWRQNFLTVRIYGRYVNRERHNFLRKKLSPRHNFRATDFPVTPALSITEGGGGGGGGGGGDTMLQIMA